MSPLKVGFVVEGDSEKVLVESPSFSSWMNGFNIEIVRPVINAKGNGNLCSMKVSEYVDTLRSNFSPDKIVVFADLDPEKCAPCITERKRIIGTSADAVVVARKALESWFLADTDAMRQWLKNGKFFETNPENTTNMPWDRIKSLGADSKLGIGPGTKVSFTKKMIGFGFTIERAAAHPNCPSAQYFVNKIRSL